MSAAIETIRQRWKDQRWPNIGYFVHGQARMDIADLLTEVDRLTKLLAEKENPDLAISSFSRTVALLPAPSGDSE